MPRPIGSRLLEAMTALEDLGPCRAGVVHAAMQDMKTDHAGQYLKRAVFHGWAKVEGKPRFWVYTAVPGWSDGVATGDRPTPSFKKRPDRIPARHQLQAVWQ